MNATEHDMDDKEKMADRRLVFVSRRYSDPRLQYVEENEEDKE